MATRQTFAAGAGFVAIQGDQFTYAGQVVKLKGTNYYPRDHMWADMWSSWNWSEIQSEAAMIQGLGMNCVRILVPYSNGGWGGANPPAARLQQLEDLVNLLGNKGVRSCVTLFDWETSFPAPGTSREAEHLSYLSAIVSRLKNNKNVLLWDVKNEPDHPNNIGGYDNWDSSPANRDKIVSWLHRMCDAVRAVDPNHPVSAGLRWWQNVCDVLPFVDVAMFHSYWPNISTQEIPDVKSYMGGNPKPILVEEFGWPSNPTPCNRDGQLIYDYNETAQLDLYTSHLTAFTAHNIAGGIQWMTFDAKAYTSNQYESFENYFGLWTYTYTLKPAGAYYRDHFPVSLFPVEPDGVPPGPVTGLTAQAASGQVSLKWTNPSDADFVGTVIRCKTTGFPVDPTDGELVADRRKPPATPDAFAQ
ncbi:MAG: cellulase family glycosylhydrolase, partial [Phycisphaerae bacterium]